MEVVDKYILIRDVGLDASGKLDKITIHKKKFNKNACQETSHVIGGRMSQHLHPTK